MEFIPSQIYCGYQKMNGKTGQVFLNRDFYNKRKSCTIKNEQTDSCQMRGTDRLVSKAYKDRTSTTYIKATDVSMNEEKAQQQCYADKAEANTTSPRPNAVFCGCVCEWRLEQLVRCYVAEGQLCVLSIFFSSFLSSPLSLSSLTLRATTRPTPSPFLPTSSATAMI